MNALTTLANVKEYLGIKTPGQDLLIPQLIIRESALVQQWTGRTFPVVVNTNKKLTGSGTNVLVLPDTPILSVSFLSINGNVIPLAADSQSNGYLYDDTTIYVIGTTFTKALQNVVCSWTSGYEATETDVVPTTGNMPTLAPATGGTAFSAISVQDITAGVALTQISGIPASGQFSFAEGVFSFNVAQYNHQVTMDYYYIPAPVEQAVIEMVGLDLQQRSNIGINSKNLATETVTFEKKGMSDSVVEMLRPFRKFGVY